MLSTKALEKMTAFKAPEATLQFPRFNLKLLFLLGFTILYFISGLAAYTIGPVPLPWIASAGFIFMTFGCIITYDRILFVPGMITFFLLFAWEIFINGLNFQAFRNGMPVKATLSYDFFILVRFLNFISFGCAYYLTYWLLHRRKESSLIRSIVFIGALWSLFAIYMYLANFYDLPSIPRTRMGTGGGEQATTFSTGNFFYYRAIGTFREPSHLAEGLFLPFFFSFLKSRPIYRICSLIIGFTLILTVSMTGIVSILTGCIAGILLCNVLHPRNRKFIVTGLLLLLLITSVSQNISISTNQKSTDLYSIISTRIHGLFENGLQGSNRGYVYEIIQSQSVDLMGYGLGNANIMASRYLESPLIVSYLNLYINMMLSVGIFGLILLLLFLLQPVGFFILNTWDNDSYRPSIILMCYLSYLISFYVLSEELTLAFAITAAFIAYQGYRGRDLFLTGSENSVTNQHELAAG